LTKSLLLSLPIDKSKIDIIEKIKSDTTIFQVDTITSFNDKFQALVLEKYTYLPTTYNNPKIEIYDIKIYVDNIYKSSSSAIRLILNYKSNFWGHRKAKNSYKRIIKIIGPDYVGYTDYNIRHENKFQGIKMKERKFYLKKDLDPACTISLNHLGDLWTITIETRLDSN
jgi:hypothetical protein